MSSQRPEHDLFGDASGLVPPTPSDDASGRGWILALTLVFLALTLLPGLVDSLWPVPAVRPVGQEAEAEAARRENLRWTDGSRTQWLEEQHRRRSRIRHWTLPNYSAAMMAGFGEVPDDLVLGPNNWLFLEHRAVPTGASDAQLMQRAVDLLTSLHDATATAGHRLVYVPIPRKGTLAREQLPAGVETRPHLEDLLAARLKQEPQLEVLDLLPALRSLTERRGETPYYAEDSHLTCVAMLETAEAVARQLGLWKPPEQRLGVLQDLGSVPPRTDLLELAGTHGSALFTYALGPTQPRRCFAVDGLPPAETAAASARVTWYGTSFSAYHDVAIYLSHFIGEPVLDVSSPGVHPLEVLQQQLGRRHRDPLTPILVMEIPNYQLFDWGRHQGLLGVDLTPPAAGSPDDRPRPGPAPSPGASTP